jgi:dTDP-4-amino-4,6-dideoxygalactose transaminase
MINYGRQSINHNDVKSVIKVLKSDFLTQGPVLEKFEKNLNFFFKSKFAVAVSSGTSALNLISNILGWKKKDLVIVSPITFLSSANCILQSGATPHFVDINMQDYSFDLIKLETEIIKLIKKRKRPKAVIVTDYAGHPADWIKLKKLKNKYGFKLINDNCHSIGASIKKNYGYAIKYADLVALSFHPVKNITTGEGGAILTNDTKHYRLLKSLRSHGVVKNSKMFKKYGPWYYEMRYLGNNYRMSDIHASLGISQLKRIKKFVKKRNFIANYYNNVFSDKSKFNIPKKRKDCEHSFHLYPLLLNFKKIKKNKKKIYYEFLKNKIKLQVHYIPVNFQPYYNKVIKFDKKKFKNSLEFYNKQISMLMYYDLNLKQLKYIKKISKKIFNI